MRAPVKVPTTPAEAFTRPRNPRSTRRARLSGGTGTGHGETRPDMKSGRGYVKQDLLFGKSHLAWRWRWDLNPRWSYPHTRFRGVLLRPLGHATAAEATRGRR